MEDFLTGFYLIYGFFTVIIIFDFLGSYFNRKMLYLKFQDFFVFLFLATYYVLLSTRSLDVGADTERYYRFYKAMYNYGDSIEGSDIGFNIFNKLLIYLGVTPSVYLFFVSLLFVVPIYFAIKQFKDTNKVYLLWFFASLFIFISMSTNILRQGIGGAFTIWGISMYLNRSSKSKKFIIPLLIAPLFHFSLLLAALLFFISKYIKSYKIVYAILLVSVVLSYNGGFYLNEVLRDLPVVGNLFLDRMDVYLRDNIKEYKVGFRVDFLLFNLFFVAMGYYISKLKFVKEKYSAYNQVYVTYILLTSCFVLMFNIPFSDRFGILSWIFIPFLVYPVFDLSNFRHNNLKLGSIVLGLGLFVIFNVLSL